MNVPDSTELRLRAVDRLINIGQWTEALDQAEDNVRDPLVASTAAAWFQLALVAGLTGGHQRRQEAAEQAGRCTDFTAQMDGDLLRDDAISCIVENKTDRAWILCERAQERHRG